MRDLNYQLLNLCRRNKDGSFSTQNKRQRTLQQCANILHQKGFRKLSATSLKPKHVNALVEHWQENKLSSGTIKNNLSAIRWWAEKVNKKSVVSRDNSSYGIENRKFVTNKDKSIELDYHKLDRIKDNYLRFSLELQAAFGLRREESIKFNAWVADKGDKIELKSSWTKGGKPREITIRNEYQRELINRIKNEVGKGSLIPSSMKFIQQLKLYENSTRTVGLSKLHGLRHHYAQQRYFELTGFKCPALTGKKAKLSKNDRAIDKKARIQISKELGHEREQITAIYLGR